MSKIFDPIEYVKRAVSKDASRGAIQHIYRDKTTLVATDGHRMHTVHYLPKVPPHFLTPYDGEFIDYDVVLRPPRLGKQYEFVITPNKDFLTTMKKLIAFAKVKGKYTPVALVMGESGASLQQTTSESRFSFSVPLPGKYKHNYPQPLRMGLNLQYFYDAISLPDHYPSPFRIVASDTYAPVHIYNDSLDIRSVIMPMKE